MIKDILKQYDSGFDLTDSIIDSIVDDSEGFRIILHRKGARTEKYKISFEEQRSYKNTNESYMLNAFTYSEKEVLGKILYEIVNSSYINSFHTISSNIYHDLPIKHYAIYTMEDCIDILSTSPPRVELL